MPTEIQSDEVTLKWTKPISNGAEVTQYTVYIRKMNFNGTVETWRTLKVIHDVSVREYVVSLQNCQQYDVMVTASNKNGESLKHERNIKRIKVSQGMHWQCYF